MHALFACLCVSIVCCYITQFTVIAGQKTGRVFREVISDAQYFSTQLEERVHYLKIVNWSYYSGL